MHSIPSTGWRAMALSMNWKYGLASNVAMSQLKDPWGTLYSSFNLSRFHPFIFLRKSFPDCSSSIHAFHSIHWLQANGSLALSMNRKYGLASNVAMSQLEDPWGMSNHIPYPHDWKTCIQAEGRQISYIYIWVVHHQGVWQYPTGLFLYHICLSLRWMVIFGPKVI